MYILLHVYIVTARKSVFIFTSNNTRKSKASFFVHDFCIPVTYKITLRDNSRVFGVFEESGTKNHYNDCILNVST